MKPKPLKKPGKPVLIFDGQCPVCRKTVEFIRENSPRGAFEFLPCQKEEVRQRFPAIKRAQCMRAMQLVLPDGAVLSGEKALPEIVKRLRRYGGLARLFDLPGSGTLSRAFYRWFADRRYHIADLLFPAKAGRRKKPAASGARKIPGRNPE